MRITILTTFPEMFAPLHTSILGRAQKAGLLDVREVDIRAYSKNKHHNTDDAPYGGGAGMVMLAQPIVDAVRDAQGEHFRGRRIFLSPRGETLTQKKAEALAREEELILLCGHYEGVDQRALDLCMDEEISVGDYVLTGGELAAMVLVDCVARLIPGVLGCGESAVSESFTSGLLEYPQYTRPREFEGLPVPEPLLNGNHREIADWQLTQALLLTLRRRPEMARAYLAGRKFSRHDRRVVDAALARFREEQAAEQAAADARALEQAEQAGQAAADSEQAAEQPERAADSEQAVEQHECATEQAGQAAADEHATEQIEQAAPGSERASGRTDAETREDAQGGAF